MVELSLELRIQEALLTRAEKKGVHSPDSALSSLFYGGEKSDWAEVSEIKIDYRGMYKEVVKITNEVLKKQIEIDFPKTSGYSAIIGLYTKKRQVKELDNFLNMHIVVLREDCAPHAYEFYAPTGINKYKDNPTVLEFSTRMSAVYEALFDSLDLKKIQRSFDIISCGKESR